MKPNNIFLLGNGSLQLINALEAAEHFLEDETDSLVCISHHQKPYEELLRLKNWGQICWRSPFSDVGQSPQPQRTFKLRRHTQDMQRLLKDHRGCQRLFVGEYTEFNRHFCNWLRPKEIIYITDGMEVAVTSFARAAALESAEKKATLSGLMRSLVYGWNSRHPTPMTFFSAVPPTLTSTDTFIQNKYHFIRDRYKDQLRLRNVTAFGGGHLYALPPGRVSIEYWARLEALTNQLDGPIEYWPHRKEPIEFIQEKCRKLGITCMSNKEPIEIAFLKNGFPAKYMSFVSTSLYTVKTLFSEVGTQVSYIQADNYLEKKWREKRRALKAVEIEEHHLPFKPEDYGIEPVNEKNLALDRRWFYNS